MNRIKKYLKKRYQTNLAGKKLEKVSVLSILMFAIEDRPVWKSYFR